MARSAFLAALLILQALLLPCDAKFVAEVQEQDGQETPPECPDGYICMFEPVPCKIPNSNEEPGPACACKDGFSGEIKWFGETPRGECEAVRCMVPKSVGSGPDAQCEDGYSGTISWNGSQSYGHCIEDEIEMKPLLDAQDTMDEQGNVRFRCCALTEDNVHWAYAVVDFLKQDSPPSDGADACVVNGPGWTASPDACMLKPSYVSEVTSAPRDAVLRALEKAKLLDGIDPGYVGLDIHVLNVNSSKIFDPDRPRELLMLKQRLESAILSALAGKAKVVEATPKHGSLLVATRIWPPAGTSEEETSAEALKAYVEKDKDALVNGLVAKFSKIEEISSASTGQIEVDIGVPKVFDLPIVYKGVARCCCKADDASTCELVREDKIKLSWDPRRWGAPVCPNHMGFHYYTRYPSLKDSLPQVCQGTKFHFLN